MSGIVSGIDYSVLFSNGGSASGVSSILNTLYSGAAASSATAVSSGNPILDLKLAQQNETKDVAQEAKNPTVVRDLAAFTRGIANAKDINTALQNPNVLKVLLTANGLGDQVQYPALASKALLSNPSDPKSLVNQLSNTAWKTVAQTYNLATKGLAGLKNPTLQAQIAAAYEKVTWLNSLDQATPGLAQAMQFKEQARQIGNVDDILGDATNRAVVTTALGIPQQIAFQDIGAQEQAISKRLDISKLKDPQFVNTLTDQYLLAMQQQNQSSAAPSLSSLSIQASGLVV
jgi:hypothetical protein